MKKLICGLCLFLFIPLLPGQNQDQAMQEMQAFVQANQPGPHQKSIEQFVGTWDVSMTLWPAPGAAPMNFTATADHKMIMGGRYLQQQVKGEMMGMSVEGMGLWGYDNMKKEHISTWIDSMSTGIMVSRGTEDADGKVFTFTGEYLDPAGKTRKSREVLRIQDADKLLAEMYETGPDGKEFKNMELIYTRK
jgi:hypothetical protein